MCVCGHLCFCCLGVKVLGCVGFMNIQFYKAKLFSKVSVQTYAFNNSTIAVLYFLEHLTHSFFPRSPFSETFLCVYFYVKRIETF